MKKTLKIHQTVTFSLLQQLIFRQVLQKRFKLVTGNNFPIKVSQLNKKKMFRFKFYFACVTLIQSKQVSKIYLMCLEAKRVIQN